MPCLPLYFTVFCSRNSWVVVLQQSKGRAVAWYVLLHSVFLVLAIQPEDDLF